MAKKYYLDTEGLQRLKRYIEDNYRSAIDDVVKPGIGIVIDDDGTISVAESVLTQGNDAAARASPAAVLAGNYAAQAIQAQNAINNKIWYGTMEEYNALETVSNSTIYIILHE